MHINIYQNLNALGILITYDNKKPPKVFVYNKVNNTINKENSSIAVIGAGNYIDQVLLQIS